MEHVVARGSRSRDLRHWGDHKLLLEVRDGARWIADKIGLGPPPLETAEGWLVLDHGVHATADGPIYRAGLALLDLEGPRTVLRRTDGVFGPIAAYEVTGDVGRVVFPCGWDVDVPNDQLFTYHGAADTVVGLATARPASTGRASTIPTSPRRGPRTSGPLRIAK